MSQPGQGGQRSDVDERIDQLNEVVSLFVEKVAADFDLELAYEPASIRYMDVFLTELHRSGRDLPPSLYLSVGGYVGETLIRNVGGRWIEGPDNLAVELEGTQYTQGLPIFEWVEAAYEDPFQDSLGEQLRAVLGDGFPAGGRTDAE